jgi:hypothetical protein
MSNEELTTLRSREYTKNNPGCYHSALYYCSEQTGISRTKEVKVKNMAGLRNKSGKQLAYKSDRIFVIDKEGNRFSYMQSGAYLGCAKRFDQCGIIADHFMVAIDRPLSEFGLEIKDAGNYNDSLGGGWSQNVSMISINGNYFAYMDCACG